MKKIGLKLLVFLLIHVMAFAIAYMLHIPMSNILTGLLIFICASNYVDLNKEK